MDPNSRGQLWSRWTFRVFGQRHTLAEIELNFAKWARKGFGSVGRVRVRERIGRLGSVYIMEAEIEGRPAHDPGYVAAVERGFSDFVRKGFGDLAVGSVKVKILAGDVQDGRPREQLVVMPTINLRDLLLS
jgi:hypothetical protein